ncbi:cytochrome oxidase small assembly protein [Polynucleobacter sp.]|uniref:cytochrome oxidase small assembly protein n=1 Tax=Polynucleobacter sp. TaxID=2029855 RepID=UPI0025864D8C|nr:cytochrome oxidase small assembly protein [Polynucleobacter sp.]MCX7237579.1 cytochrome oxidase small assembly protein [Polynucleobacter sp.]
MALRVLSGQYRHQHHTILLKLRLAQSRCVKQEFNSSGKQALAANNRRMGFILLSVVAAFFIGIVIKRSLLG